MTGHMEYPSKAVTKFDYTDEGMTELLNRPVAKYENHSRDTGNGRGTGKVSLVHDMKAYEKKWRYNPNHS
jgi:hypothetical protein